MYMNTIPRQATFCRHPEPDPADSDRHREEHAISQSTRTRSGTRCLGSGTTGAGCNLPVGCWRDARLHRHSRGRPLVVKLPHMQTRRCRSVNLTARPRRTGHARPRPGHTTHVASAAPSPRRWLPWAISWSRAPCHACPAMLAAPAAFAAPLWRWRARGAPSSNGTRSSISLIAPCRTTAAQLRIMSMAAGARYKHNRIQCGQELWRGGARGTRGEAAPRDAGIAAVRRTAAPRLMWLRRCVCGVTCVLTHRPAAQTQRGVPGRATGVLHGRRR